MTGNIFGNRFVLVAFGESHGKCVGAVVDGCPAGLPLSEKDIQKELDRRRPGQSDLTTTRGEFDEVEILSGLFEGYTTGAPICMIVWNKDVDSSKYERFRYEPRPGHADYTGRIRYGGFNDYRGGGRFSGRTTISYVMGGAIAKKVLSETLKIEIIAHTVEIGGIKAGSTNLEKIRNSENNPVRCADPEAAEEMIKRIKQVQGEKDSLGGVVECLVLNMPAGLGDPVFDTLEGDLSKALYAIPGVKSVEFGSGVNAARMTGSQHNDPFFVHEGKVITLSNYAGGILGGISNGMPITCRVTVKPTPSIGKPQKTVDLRNMKETIIEIEGRHDPCIVPRAVPIVEAMVALVIVDHAISANLIPRVLKKKT
ncbi:MAG: chorismate synthase [Candidatus Jordarchaeaceae archaeon]